jgi:Zn-dependent protease
MAIHDRHYSRGSGWNPGGAGGGGIGERVLSFLNASFPIGRVLGIRVRVHITFLLLLIVELIQQRDPLWTLRWTALLFGSVLLHEFGHCLACRRVGGRADEILMWPLGGLAYCAPPRRPWPEFVTVVWGPLVTLILAAIGYVSLLAWYGSNTPVTLNPFELFVSRPPTVAARWLADIFAVNYILLLFNVLMIFWPFDGGRLLQVAMWTRIGYVRSMRASATWGMIGAIAVGLFGFASGHMMLLLIAVFGFMACLQQRRMLEGASDYDFPDEGSFAPGQPKRESWLSQRRRAREQRSRQRAQQAAAQREAAIDAILDKIHREGITSLTPREKDLLAADTRAKQSR